MHPSRDSACRCFAYCCSLCLPLHRHSCGPDTNANLLNYGPQRSGACHHSHSIEGVQHNKDCHGVIGMPIWGNTNAASHDDIVSGVVCHTAWEHQLWCCNSNCPSNYHSLACPGGKVLEEEHIANLPIQVVPGNAILKSCAKLPKVHLVQPARCFPWIQLAGVPASMPSGAVISTLCHM